jgi:ribosomal protein S27AE/tetratricopeptide (TPR) repeat protein
MSDPDVAENATELFAYGFMLSHTAFSAILNSSGAAEMCAWHEALARTSSKVLARCPQYLPAMIVRSRIQEGDDIAKLQIQEECMNIMAVASICKEWKRWKATLHEMIGLTHGGMRQHRSAVPHYKAALQCGASRTSSYLCAQCLHTIGEHQEAHKLLDDYLSSVANDKAYDDYHFPNALYLKGTFLLRANQDLASGRECYAQATAAESKRCSFFGSVSCVAKDSLRRICNVAFGSASEREKSLAEFAAKYQTRGTLSESTPAHVSATLNDIDTDELLETPASGSRSSDSGQLRVHILELSRHPASLRDELLHGASLAACRDALVESGVGPTLPSGASLFSDPVDFSVLKDALEAQDLKPWHVVATSEFLDAVLSSVNNLRSRDQVRVKSKSLVPISKRTCANCGQTQPRFSCGKCHTANYCSRDCQRLDYPKHIKVCSNSLGLPVVVSRTFLDVKLPSNSTKCSAVTKSTTDADDRKGINPRSVCSALFAP